MQKKVILIKLGGSVITNKEVPMKLRGDVLGRLVREIAQARQDRPDTLFIVGHGSGSFGHVPAAHYGTMDGFKDPDSRLGMAVVQDKAAQLNRLVVKAFLEVGLPAVTLAPSNSFVTNQRKMQSSFLDVLLEYGRQGLLPVTYGDVLVDAGQGCTIWSTEEVLSFLAEELVQLGWRVEQVLHVTEVDGFYGENNMVVPKITPENWTNLQQLVTGTKGYDVTGGMSLKIGESLELAQKGIESKILSGLQPNNVLNALRNYDWIGTAITA